MFVQPIACLHTRKDKLFGEDQKASLNDVQRAFGEMQARFTIIQNSSLAWDKEILMI